MPYLKGESRPKEQYWYVVSLYILNRPRLVPYHFESEEQAVRCVEQKFDYDFRNYPVITGKEAIKHKLIFFDNPRHMGGEKKFKRYSPLKYDYPTDRLLFYQKRKTFRTVQRRKARRAKLREQKNDT